MAKSQTRYTLALERDSESGWWTGQLEELPECITQGRTIEQTRVRMREALALVLDDDAAAEKATFVDRVKLGAALDKKLEAARVARAEAETASERAVKATRSVLEAIVSKGIGVRDAAALTGISFQRVAQLVPGKASAKSGRARAAG